MWQWAKTVNQKLKQNTQTQDADGIQGMSVPIMPELQVIYQH